METRKEREDCVEDLAALLGEHFDAVQILVSGPADGGGTECIKKGCGNWYARQGMAHEFINQDIAQEHAKEISEALEPPPEEWK
jgi:hypothetical protein